MILDKAKMAHEWFMKHGNPKTTKHSLFLAWDYANAMQNEEDKRKPKGLPDVLKMANSPQLNNESILHNIDCYFDNANNTKRDADNLIQSIYEHLTGEVKVNVETTDVSEWQPDWSQAPAWANYIAVYSDYCNASYFEKEPKIISGYTWGGTDGKSLLTPIPVYTGNWKDSLRKRPQ